MKAYGMRYIEDYLPLIEKYLRGENWDRRPTPRDIQKKIVDLQERYEAGNLDDEAVAALTAIPGWSWEREDWHMGDQARLSYLIQYLSHTEHKGVPTRDSFEGKMIAKIRRLPPSRGCRSYYQMVTNEMRRFGITIEADRVIVHRPKAGDVILDV